MAYPLKGDGLQLADGTTVISSTGLVDGRDVSADGAELDAYETTAHAWTAHQYATPKVLPIEDDQIQPAFAVSGHGNTYEVDLANASGDLLLSMASGCLNGMRWSILVIADGVHELTYEAGHTFGTETAPDFSAMADGTEVLLEFYARSGSRVLVAASVQYAP